jgi:hypothetical protein
VIEAGPIQVAATMEVATKRWPGLKIKSSARSRLPQQRSDFGPPPAAKPDNLIPRPAKMHETFTLLTYVT